MTKVHRIHGARLTDTIFEIVLKTGEHVFWNVTKLQEAAAAGAFGEPRYARTCDLPPAKWDGWGPDDRATVDWMKTNKAILDEPAIAIESENPEYFVNCFADGQHRITARQELGLPEVAFYVVPLDLERAFRVEGFPPPLPWKPARYPGDPVRLVAMSRGDDLGDVRIQHYGESVRVAAFLPGRHVVNEGDTPKTEPERCSYYAVATESPAADAAFDAYVDRAKAEGWSVDDARTKRFSESDR